MTPRLCRDCLVLTAPRDAPARPDGEDPRTGGDAPRPGPARCPACGSPRLLEHPELLELSLAHIDCDAFYASVEKRDRPELRDAPVIVGGGVRGVVTTCCYLARTFGVRSAMPMFKALRLCPDAVVVRPDFRKYQRESRAVFDRVRALTPLVQPLSLDEAWLDLSGSERLHGGPAAWVLARLQAEIEREVGLTVSIGLAPNKLLAKIASDLDKPRGFAVVGRRDAARRLAVMPLRVLPGVGPATLARLEGHGLTRVGQVAELGAAELRRRFGPSGARLAALARGEDARPVDPEGERKSISKERTFDEDVIDPERLRSELWPLAEGVAAQARAQGLGGRTVALKMKDHRFRLVTRRRTGPDPVRTAREIHRTAVELLEAARRVDAPPLRLIGVGLLDLEARSASDERLFPAADARDLAAEAALDQLRARFGDAAVVRARALGRGPRRDG